MKYYGRQYRSSVVGQPVLRIDTYRYVVMYLRKQHVGSYAVMYVCM